MTLAIAKPSHAEAEGEPLAATKALPTVVVTPPLDVAGCVTANQLAQRLDQAFSGSALPPADYELHVDISKNPSGGLDARIAWQRPNASARTRTISTSSPDCRELDDALALVARALWDGEQQAAAEATTSSTAAPDLALPPAPKPIVVPAPARFPSPVASDRPVGPERNTRRGHVELAGGGAVMVGLLDDAVIVPRLDVRVPIAGRLALRAATTWLPWGHAQSVDGAQVELSALTGRISGCWSLPTSFLLDGCVGLDGGLLSTRGSQIRGEAQRRRPLLWPIGVLISRYTLAGPLVAQAELGAGPALFRDDFYVTDLSGEQRRIRGGAPALFEGGLSLGVALR